MMGIEGLALLRTAIDADDEFVAARVAEMRHLADPDADGLPVPKELTELDAAAGYAAWAGGYDSLPNFVIAVEEPAVRSLTATLPAGRALDAACGTGRHAVHLAARGHEVTGVDQSPEMLAHAAGKVPGARFETGTLEKLPLPDESFDLVVCALALSHLPSVAPAVGELRRVLAPGGRLIVTDIHPVIALLHGQALFKHPAGGLAFVRNHVHWASDYLTAFRAHGLDVRSCQEPLFAGPLPPGGYEERIPDAAQAAWQGTPSAIVWEAVPR
ncbi:class I SAM-dependent methyltransferase [Catenuloplanes japonicus]|uniref:class I SAM-dependent methyltransferase n=1 Tax=Catenuloplanes japonicus TaxID=33876 RepID=UPI000A5176C7|nr:class I SAM-dependent methyltransferase [Catenuloplanes japonicus]